MATKKRSSHLPRKVPASPSITNSPEGILRRSTTNSASPTSNRPKDHSHDAKVRRQEYDLQASAYANDQLMNTSGETDYRPNNQHSKYSNYPNRENVEDDEDSFEEEELQTEREENNVMVQNPNDISERRDQQYMDDRVKYVKRPQMESEVSEKEKANPVTIASLSKRTPRPSNANLPNYDPRMEYNTSWKGTGSVPTYGSHFGIYVF